ncbi:hypothetical protein AMECASPLE_010318 [Ameca splendens]|uniref:Uncharacterized protein n=1 Tax=Ameca splendens TaxID=208324 RepID=A0ABV0ZZA2_9TELE
MSSKYLRMEDLLAINLMFLRFKSPACSRIQKASPHFVGEPPTHCIRAAGVLKYNREPESYCLNIITSLLEIQQPRNSPIKCGYCGKNPCPSLDLTWIQDPKIAPRFCCTQRQHLFQTLVKNRFLFGAGCEWNICNLMTENDKPAKERRGMFCQSKKIEDRNKFTTGLKSGLGTQMDLRTGSNHTSQHVAETSKYPVSNIHFDSLGF